LRAKSVQELDQEKLTPLLRLKYNNSIADAVAHLGKPEDIGRVFIGFQKYLYQQEARLRGGVRLADWPDTEGTATVADRTLTRATRQGTRIANPPDHCVDRACHGSRLSVASQGIGMD
jgi:hypothetical protein